MASARHELIRRPSTMTVQAPHWPRSQPFFVPVNSRCSRRRSRSVTRGSSRWMVLVTPFTLSVVETGIRWLPKAMIRQTVDRRQFYLSLPRLGRNGKIAETRAKEELDVSLERVCPGFFDASTMHHCSAAAIYGGGLRFSRGRARTEHEAVGRNVTKAAGRRH